MDWQSRELSAQMPWVRPWVEETITLTANNTQLVYAQLLQTKASEIQFTLVLRAAEQLNSKQTQFLI